ncbi:MULTISPECIES: hypothetical protein [Streptomyces]|uniref:hypothetical protein n=1 Tax=Streptomyces TaxID=1883 RepID=UPI0006F51F2C|nr:MULTISPECIES: hypothetical protein [unclassified Streptomyces]KQX86174.1 hypothetical protein ASD26_26810 [Streptomyces sp. Root1319]KQZ17100.1 hypothetical protein ASD51_05085 [Streptomyces sp. Root55]MDX3063270.1 hypothetical protein [Streptomyces sp. ND04-05B]RPK83836.1 hypothetical protein EES45_05910 [Streptomyces sp. ADI97-07]
MTYIDWHRKRCFVEPTGGGGKAKWSGLGFERAIAFELMRATREVLLGADPDVALSRRAVTALAEARDHFVDVVRPGGTLITRTSSGQVRWWTWAGHRANAMLAATLGMVAAPAQRVNDCWIRLPEDVDRRHWKQTVADMQDQLCLPDVDQRAVKGLKFGGTLPPRLAQATLATRFADLEGARAVLKESVRFVGLTSS